MEDLGISLRKTIVSVHVGALLAALLARFLILFAAVFFTTIHGHSE